MVKDDDKKPKTAQLVLDLELQDFLDVVSKAGGRSSISDSLSEHVVEGEALKKAWFKHVLLTLEKLNDYLETTRVVEIPQLRQELREEIAAVKKELKDALEKLEHTVEKNEDDLKVYKKDTIDPMSKTLTTLSVKTGILATVFSFFGSGLMALIIYLLRDYILKGMLGG